MSAAIAILTLAVTASAIVYAADHVADFQRTRVIRRRLQILSRSEL